MKTFAVLVSGTGSLLEAMIKDGLWPCLVSADRDCRGLEIARQAGIEAVLIERTDFTKRFNRRDYTMAYVDMFSNRGVEFVAMAGFKTILDPIIFEMGYCNRILNTHPALLPAFKGHHAVCDALAAGVKVTGCTIHIATEELDAGRILAQGVVDVLSDDTEATLHERIKQVERILYPCTIRDFSDMLDAGLV